MMRQYVPAHSDIIREAVVVMIGALIAAFIVRQLPAQYQNLFSLTPAPKPATVPPLNNTITGR